MKIGLVGRKLGMTRVFSEDGNSIPVTAIEVQPNSISSIMNSEKNGYSAVQLAYGTRRVSRLNKPFKGALAKADIGVALGLREFRLNEVDVAAYKVGMSLTLDSLSDAIYVDVTSNSKGKGFQGVIKRWNFSMQDATHGNSLSHRAPGSIGQNQSPGRVFKGKKMAGHMGDERVTTQNLLVVRLDAVNNLLLVKGSVPGAEGAVVVIKPAVKHGI
jgi:large subunit ribosomal protein L3